MNIQFLSELLVNNNREWFQEHKGEYNQLKQEFEELVEKLLRGIYVFDPSIGLQSVKECTYRIYHDMRFAHFQEPYKTWLGAYICPGGKKSGYAGYYFHLEPSEGEYLYGCMLAVGLYAPDKEIVKNIRQGILDEGDRFDKAVKQSKNMVLDDTSKLQRVPPGYPKEHQYADYLKYRNFCLMKRFSLDGLSNEELLKTTLKEFKSAKEFCSTINEFAFSRHNLQAIDY